MLLLQFRYFKELKMAFKLSLEKNLIMSKLIKKKE